MSLSDKPLEFKSDRENQDDSYLIIMPDIDTQNGKVLQYLKDYESIDLFDSLKHIGCSRLQARVSDLKRMGHDIVTVQHSTNPQACQYMLRTKYEDMIKKMDHARLAGAIEVKIPKLFFAEHRKKYEDIVDVE